MSEPGAIPAKIATRFRVGTASWTDPTLLASGFYPAAQRTAEARLRFYAEHFDTVEVDSTYYALPSERNAVVWADRTPADFVFHVKAFAWLTQHEAETRSLPAAIRERIAPAQLAARRLGAPTEELRETAFEFFLAALQPLRQAGKLGCILLQFPPWFTASTRNREYLRLCRARCDTRALAVEFRHSSWFGEETGRTLDWLTRHELTLVAIDAPQAPSIPQPPFQLTTEQGYVRFHGRDHQAWFRRGVSAAERFRYLYSTEELEALSHRVRALSGASQVHVLFNNCYADHGVRNALTMRALLGSN